MVVGDNPEEQLAPFDENLEVPEYYYDEVSERDKQRMMDYYSSETNVSFSSFEECYKEYGERWNGNRWRKCEDGVWRIVSTYNPKSKWDWYQLGGRWSGKYIKLKPGATSGIVGEPSWCSKGNGIDAAKKGDITPEALADNFVPYAYVKDGEWHGKGEMGWWCVQSNCKAQEEWEKEFWDMFNSLPDDTMIWFYDLHI